MSQPQDFRWVEVRCGNIRRGASVPCDRQLGWVLVSPRYPDELIERTFGPRPDGDARGGSGRADVDHLRPFPPPPTLPRRRVTAVTDDVENRLRHDVREEYVTLPSGMTVKDSISRERYTIRCSPKRCGRTHHRREERLAALALDEIAKASSRLYLT